MKRPTVKSQRRFLKTVLPGLLCPCMVMILGLPALAQSKIGLVGHWKLDEGVVGGIVADATASSLDGQPAGFDPATAAANSVPGKIGRAVRFSSAGAIRLDKHAPVLDKLTDFTVSMWIQYDGGGSRMLFSFSDGTLSHRIQMEVNGGRLSFGWQDGGGWQRFATNALAWEPGRWYHVVFTNDSTTGKSILRSNDLTHKTHSSTLSPGGLKSPVKRVAIGSLNGGYPYNGRIDDVRLFDSALALSDQLALYEAPEGVPDDPQWVAAKTAMVEKHRRMEMARRAREEFLAEEAPRLSKRELQQKTEWLFQAEVDDLSTRTGKEIVWTREMIDRLQKRNDAPDLSDELIALKKLEQAASNGTTATDATQIRKLYFDVRALKRRVMLKSPEIDFSQIVFVDVPYTQGPQWQHESRYRSAMCAAPGGELLVLEGLSPDGEPRKLAPLEGRAALLRPDVSYDGRRVLFCMMPEGEKAYHLYEIGVNGQGIRQITSGKYSDLDPVYLPDGNIVFLTSRSNVSAGCGPWAPQHTMARCDRDGKNIYLLSVASEPEYSPSVLADGRVIYTRWEYNDKALNRIQSLWTMNPDGTGSATYWGNQSTYPDHLGEARSIPGTSLVMFNGMGHHDMYGGCIAVLDTAEGLNFPRGVKKVTADVSWPEVNDGPVPTPPVANDYHASGRIGGYKSPYPLSEELFLVSARSGNCQVRSSRDPERGFFKLYLMDIHGNRELIYQGKENVLYAQPIRTRPRPPVLRDAVAWPGPEHRGKAVAPSSFYSADVYEGLPEEMRGKGKYLRVTECVQRNYTTGCVDGGGSPFGSKENVAVDHLRNGTWGDGAILAGPAIAISSNTRLKRVLGTVPIADDGSSYFNAPAGKALYFQLLDENHLVLQSMRSWVNLMPGERRGCVGCHEGQQNTSAATKTISFVGRRPDEITPPSWGVRTLSYVKDIQPIFDKNCAKCHQGEGKAREKLDLTLRPDPEGRWGGIFPEPYITLTCGPNNVNHSGRGNKFAPTIAGNFFIWASPYATMPPMTKWSYKSPLINMHLHGKHNDVKLTAEEMHKLIVWVDTNCHYRSLEDVLSISDPDPAWFQNWPYAPRLKSAPYVSHLHAQDEFNSPSDRATLRSRYAEARTHNEETRPDHD